MKKTILFFVLFIPLMLLSQENNENQNNYKYTINRADSLSDIGKYVQSNKVLLGYLNSNSEPPRNKAELLSAIIDNYNSSNNIDSSKVYIDRFEKFITKEKLNSLESRLFFYRGGQELFLNNLKEALQFYLTSLNLAKTNNQKEEEIRNYIVIGRVLFTNRDLKKAKQYLEEAYEGAKNIKNKPLKVKAAMLLADCYAEEKKYNDAIHLLKNIEGDIRKNIDLLTFYSLLTKFYLENGNQTNSFQYAQKVYELLKNTEMPSNAYGTISKTRKIIKLPDSLILKNLENYEQRIEEEIKHDLGRVEFQEALLTVSQQDKNILEELKQLKTTLKLKDSIYSVEKEKVVTELETKYQTKEKELIIAEEKKKKLGYASLFGFAFLCLLFFIYYAYNRKRKIEQNNKLDLVEIAYKNKLALVTTKQKAHNDIGKELHDIKAKDLERIAIQLENKGETTIASEVTQIKDSIRHLSSELQSISFEESSFIDQLITLGAVYSNKTRKIKFQGIKDIDWLLISDTIKRNLFLVIREGISNAVLHGKASIVTVACKNISKHIEVSIIDNGTGFDPKQPVSGIGMRSMKMRIHELNGTVQFKSVPEEGTSIFITIVTA